MARWIVRISLCIILGIVTTVGVAWGCTRWAEMGPREELPSDDWPVLAKQLRSHELSGLHMVDAWFHRSAGETLHLAGWADSTGEVVVGRGNLRAGLPVRSMSYWFERDDRTASGTPHGVLELFGGGYPLIPILPGFLVNTIFYAGVWFGIFFGVGFVKRVLRSKRGRCVKCSYDLRGAPGDDEGCPECGWNRSKPQL